jgi:hypothetical protein
MNIETLLRALERKATVKLYVVSAGFCMCGIVRSARVVAEGLQLTTGASIRVALPSLAVTTERFGPTLLLLTTADKFTRRLQTHRRHVWHSDIPEQYFRTAEAL